MAVSLDDIKTLLAESQAKAVADLVASEREDAARGMFSAGVKACIDAVNATDTLSAGFDTKAAILVALYKLKR